MLNKIIRFSLQNRVVVLVITGILMLWGCITMMRSDIDIFPDLNAPTVAVMTEAPGMTPEEVEKMVTYPIETALNGATDVRRVRSSSATGFSIVWVEFNWDADPYVARQIVSEKLASVEGQLPPGTGTPILGPQSSILGEIMIIGLTSTSDSVSMTQLRSVADRIITPRLLALGGVAQVSVIGGDVAEYQIRLSQDRMKHLGVSLDEVRQAVEGINSNRSGGVLYDYGNEYLITVDMHTAATEQLAKSVIRSDERGVVTIADVADVTMGTESPKLGTASERTKPAVLLTVAKQPSTSTIDLTDGIETTLNELKQSLPAGINISTDIFRQSDFIDNSISNLQTSLLEGALFVIIVLFVFLMNFRTTLISVVALPISIIVTILLLNAFGLTINTMSLGGIAIAIGSLVDDAIVDVENVYRRLRINAQLPEDDRLTTREVVFEASREVRLPIINSTLIIAASFMPLFFLDGIGGRMLIPLGISFITALAASTVVALTVTPALCSFLLGNKGYNRKLQRDPGITRVLVKAYRRSLSAVMRHRIMALAVTGVLLAGALVCFFMAGRSFLPSFNEGSLTINVSTLPGISLEESDRIGREAERIILSMPEIKTTARKTGRAELDEHSLGINVSEIEAPYTLSGRSREEMVRDLRHKLSHLPGTNIEIGQPISHRIDAMLSGTEAQIAIKIFGSDLETLHNLATGIRHSISEIDGIVDVAVEQQTARPQIDIRPRRDMLARYGITNGQFASAVAKLRGRGVGLCGMDGQMLRCTELDPQLGHVGEIVHVDATLIESLLDGGFIPVIATVGMDDNGIPYNITLKADHGVTGRLDDISQIMIDSREGKIPLSYVADVVSTSGPNTINRENANRRIIVSANVDGRDLKGAVSDIQKSIGSSVKLPEGYFIKYGGQFESEEAASRTLAIASLAALIVIFILLLQEYHNIAQSAVILVNMPLALIGGIFALELTGSEINIPATIGFISLMGIATRGGMLLMSHYNALEKNGVPLYDRIVKGSSDRLNPIVMTALTSALALIPLALRGGQPGNEIQSPMAVVILGGLFSSTLLNLYIVPILYAYISSRNRKKK